MTSYTHPGSPDSATQYTVTPDDAEYWQIIRIAQAYSAAYTTQLHKLPEKQSPQESERSRRATYATEQAMNDADMIPEERVGATITAAEIYRIAQTAGAAGQYLIETTIAAYNRAPDDNWL